ncbi:hypothetical protein OAO01_09260, partial [Oligoflexia bacterium]|nr:hypothetical protein [Oligoflexia bacterium]
MTLYTPPKSLITIFAVLTCAIPVIGQAQPNCLKPTVVLQNTTERNVTFSVPSGRYFVTMDSATQDIVVRDLPHGQQNGSKKLWD